MTIEQLGTRIGMPAEGIAEAERCLAALPDREPLLALLERDETSFLQAVSDRPEANRLVLALFLWYAAGQADSWKEQGIPETVYSDTMRDLTLWYRECVRQTGAPGLVEWDWLLLSLKGRLVRLGRLQYQPRTLGADLHAGGKTVPKGTPVLEVHIPADGKLDPDAAADSFRQAQAWFSGKGYQGFHCHSWLLCPDLKRLLAEDANILRFQAMFQVYETDSAYRQAEERVFGCIRDEVEEYPEQTSLQRKLKAYLRDNEPLGMGKGWIPFDKQF